MSDEEATPPDPKEKGPSGAEVLTKVLTSEVFRDLLKNFTGDIRAIVDTVSVEKSKREEARIKAQKESEDRWYRTNTRLAIGRWILQISALGSVTWLAYIGTFKAEVAAPLFVAIVASLFVQPNRPGQISG